MAENWITNDNQSVTPGTSCSTWKMNTQTTADPAIRESPTQHNNPNIKTGASDQNLFFPAKLNYKAIQT